MEKFAAPDDIRLSQGLSPQLAKQSPILSRLRVHLSRLLLLFLASYGLLDFCYKYEPAWSGVGYDFRHYYNMYLSPLDLHAAVAPFVCRQIGALATHLVLATHLYYPADIQFNDAKYDQHVLFAALFTNWIFLVLTAWLAGLIAEQELAQRNAFVAIIAGFLCLLAFQSQLSVITGLTEGTGWFLMAAGVLAYQRRARLPLLIIITLAIFQRETVVLALGSIALFQLALTGREKSFRLQVCVWSALCMSAYIIVRRLFIPGNNNQTHFAGIVSSLQHIPFGKPLLFQGLLSQNVLAIFLIIAFLTRHSIGIKRLWVQSLLATFVLLDIVGLATGIGNNIGRVAAILTPVFAALAAAGLWNQRRLLE